MAVVVDDVAVVSACLPVVSGSQRATATIETAAKAAQMALGSRYGKSPSSESDGPVSESRPPSDGPTMLPRPHMPEIIDIASTCWCAGKSSGPIAFDTPTIAFGRPIAKRIAHATPKLRVRPKSTCGTVHVASPSRITRFRPCVSDSFPRWYDVSICDIWYAAMKKPA